MKAAETTLLGLLQGSKVFLIPNFQRRYAWRKQQWEELWDDLIREYSADHDPYSRVPDGHFLGSVVLHPAPGKSSVLMRHLVIDGQQRLTTVLVLLAALRDFRSSVEAEWDPNSYDSRFLTNPFDQEYPDRLVPTEADREAYVQTLRHGVPTGGIGQAYSYFRTEIESAYEQDGLQLGRLGDVLLMHMLLVEINTSTGDSVNNIFNTLNSKGLPLSSTDLIRNELLLNLDEKAANDAYRNYWTPIERTLTRTDARGTINDSALVTFFWAREVPENPNVTKKNLFQSFERSLRARLESGTVAERPAVVRSLFEELWSDFDVYQTILDPLNHKSEKWSPSQGLRESLARLKAWGSEPYIPTALWVAREVADGRIEDSDGTATLNTLLGYLVRRALFGLPTNNLNRMLSGIPSVLNSRPGSSKATQAIQGLLSRATYRWPSDGDVREAVTSQPIYLSVKRAQAAFLLTLVEEVMAGPVPVLRPVVEHFVPASLWEDWEHEISLVSDDFDELEAVVHTLGNLVLGAHGKAYVTGGRAERVSILESSPYEVNHVFAEQKSWSPEAIRERSLKRANILLTVLAGPVGRTFFDEETRSRDLRGELFSALQSMPDGFWVTEGELIKFLGADGDHVRKLVLDTSAVLARLVRGPGGEIPAWFGSKLRDEVAKQDMASGAPSPESNIGAEAIANLVMDASGMADTDLELSVSH